MNNYCKKAALVLGIFLLALFIGSAQPGPAYAGKEARQKSSPAAGKISYSNKWINPLAGSDSTVTVQNKPSLRTLSIPSASNLEGLQAEITSYLYKRVASFNIYYTGDSSKLDLKGLMDNILSRDDYLHYSINRWEVKWSGNANEPINFALVYLTTMEEENFVDREVTRILGEILSPGMSEDEKEAAINEYLVSHVAYDETLKNHSAYAALHDGHTVCQGYALLAFKMLKEAGIANRIITGQTGKGGQWVNHSWNLVRINNCWYHLDTTWNDPTPDQPGRVLYNYYNMSDELISGDHTWNREEFPAATTVYYEHLLQAMNQEPAQAAYIKQLMKKVDLQYVWPEYTANHVQDMENKLRINLKSRPLTYKIRTFRPVLDEYSLADIFEYGMDVNDIHYLITEYIPTPDSGDVLLTLSLGYGNKVTAVNLNQAACELAVNQTRQLQAQAFFSSGTTAVVTADAVYESSAPGWQL